MNLQEYRYLQAERSALESLLAELPEGREIESLGLHSRKLEIEELLATQQPSLSREHWPSSGPSPCGATASRDE